MTTLTLDERRERIEQDDGPLDETVYRQTARTRAIVVYHATTECRQIRGAVRESTRGEEQRIDNAPCKLCVLDGGEQPENRDDECPFCGEDVSFIARHLPKCDGSEGVAEVDGL